ncbi:MAG: TIR domain-containing protein [Dehalococcoidales bacterium]
MTDLKNVFISHIHEDDTLLANLKDLISRAGMEVRDASITDEKPNEAQNEQYIKYQILAPKIDWASTLVVLISHNTTQSDYVNWEIKYAVDHDKRVVGVFVQGATDADIPEELGKIGDAAIVGWQGERVVDAINGKLTEWDDPKTGNPRDPTWRIKRYKC